MTKPYHDREGAPRTCREYEYRYGKRCVCSSIDMIEKVAIASGVPVGEVLQAADAVQNLPDVAGSIDGKEFVANVAKGVAEMMKNDLHGRVEQMGTYQFIKLPFDCGECDPAFDCKQGCIRAVSKPGGLVDMEAIREKRPERGKKRSRRKR
jgi:hypothetical protein